MGRARGKAGQGREVSKSAAAGFSQCSVSAYSCAAVEADQRGQGGKPRPDGRGADPRARQAPLVGISLEQPTGPAASLGRARLWRLGRGGDRRALVFDGAADRRGDDRRRGRRTRQGAEQAWLSSARLTAQAGVAAGSLKRFPENWPSERQLLLPKSTTAGRSPSRRTAVLSSATRHRPLRAGTTTLSARGRVR